MDDKKIAPKKKKGSSSTVIIAVIIIIAVILLALGLKSYLNNRDHVLLERFPEEFQEDINKVEEEYYETYSTSYKLPENFTEICLANRDYDNLILKEGDKRKIKQLDNVDLNKTTKGEEMLCMEIIDQKIWVKFRKENNSGVIVEERE